LGGKLSTFKTAIAGYFANHALQNAQNKEISLGIDIKEHLPSPQGLVEYGVAPDHPKIKTFSKVFENTAKDRNFRLVANVELDKDESSIEYAQDGLEHDHRYSINRSKIECLGNRVSQNIEYDL
jgi:NADPH-dependent glutamate synthase beta subunit-like oxidoreductase